MLRRHLLAGVVVTIVFGLAAPRPRSAAQNSRVPLAFTHVTVLDTEHALRHEDQTVLVAGDRISDVGRSNSVSIPEGAQVVDARGKFLIPGLWDMHVHTFRHNPRSTDTWFFPLFVANGVTGVRDMWTTADDFPQVVRWRRGLTDGSLLVPRYESVGWLVDGPQPFFPYSDVVSTPQQARDFVHNVKAAGIDFVKVYSKLPPEEYLAIADEARKVGIPFAGHVPDMVSAAAASDAGQRSMEHLRNIALGCSAKEEELLTVKNWGPPQIDEVRETYDRHKCDELMARFARNQTWQVPTLVVHPVSHAWLGTSAPPVDVNLSSDPRLKYVPAARAADWRQRTTGRGESPEQQQRDRLGFEDRLAETVALSKSGVPLLAGTDVRNPFVYPGFSLHDELELFVRAGLTPGEALRTATFNPAKFLGVQDRLGTIDKGKLADLVLLDANPLEDIRNTQKIRAVVLNGRYLDRRSLDKLLADAAIAATR